MSNPAPVADVEAGTITRTIRIDAPRDVVWTALTSPEHIATWWGHPSDFPDGWRPTSVGTFAWEEHTFGVRIDVLDPESEFAITWGGLDVPFDEAAANQVRFTLEADGAATVVTVVESGFTRFSDVAARRAEMDGNVDGWTIVLDSLQEFAQARRLP